MRKIFILAALAMATSPIIAATTTVSSPDGQLVVTIVDDNGSPTYAIDYAGRTMMLPSALGVYTSAGDFSRSLKLVDTRNESVKRSYTMRNSKASTIEYEANRLDLTYENARRRRMTVTFCVANNDVAFRYSFDQMGDMASLLVTGEATAFRLPTNATAFVSPQSDPMIGWKRTKPSYEEVYSADAPLTDASQYGQGYVFPALFRVANDGWVLLSETGTDGRYVGCHLSDYGQAMGYQIAFPMPGEANGHGTTDAALRLPGSTPWRTITVGATLEPIVETTVAWDVVEPKYEPSIEYAPGRYTWSWLVWQDNSVNYDDQVAFIDVAATMGYEYCLVDGLWDKQIGRERLEQLSRYAQSKGVRLLVWYNSNGAQNDAPQGPKGCMDTSIARRKEMAWLKSIGVAGIKVDFFGGDKQHTIQLYEDILADANDFGIQVIFHGCTLPRGWERMYPNFVSSEAVLASENVIFTEAHARREAFDLTLHPFCRNAIAAMDWGGTIMNRHMSRDNKSRHSRQTTDIFELAAAVVNQSSVQCIAIQPNNLDELTPDVLRFLRNVPTAWDETQFIDGYPGRYVVLARRSGDRWIVAGMNATAEPLKLKLTLPMLAGEAVELHTDKPSKGGAMAEPQMKRAKVGSDGRLSVTIQPNGGMVCYKE